jgi:hypothetical protein
MVGKSMKSEPGQISISDIEYIIGEAKREAEIADDFYLLSNLSPKSTRLLFVVWISPRGPRSNVSNDIRVKVSKSHKVKEGEFVVVSVRPQVEVLRGELRPAEFGLLKKWIESNREVLVRFWDGDIAYTEEVLKLLKPLTAGQVKVEEP